MSRFNIRIESNTTRSKTRIVLTMTRSKIRIVKRPSLQIGHSCSSCREGGYKQWNEGGSEGASRRGRKQSKKKGGENLPSTPRHGGLQQDEEHFLVKLLRSRHLG